MKFFIKDFFSKCDQILRKLRIWSHLLKKSLMENSIFCEVLISDMITDMYKNNFFRDFEKRNPVIQNPMMIEQCTFAKLKVW